MEESRGHVGGSKTGKKPGIPSGKNERGGEDGGKADLGKEKSKQQN